MRLFSSQYCSPNHSHIREAKSHFGIICRMVQIFVPHKNLSYNNYFTFKELCIKYNPSS